MSVTFNLQVVCVIILVFIFVWWAENTRSRDLKWWFFGLGVALILIEHASNTQTGPLTNQDVFLLARWCRRVSSGVAAGCCVNFSTMYRVIIKHMWYPIRGHSFIQVFYASTGWHLVSLYVGTAAINFQSSFYRYCFHWLRVHCAKI